MKSHDKSKNAHIEKINKLISEQKKMEFTYKKLGVKFEEINGTLNASRMGHSSKWKEMTPLLEMSMVGIAMISSQLEQIIKKIEKSEKKKLKKS